MNVVVCAGGFENCTGVDGCNSLLPSGTEEVPVLPLFPRPVARCRERFLKWLRHEYAYTQPQTTQTRAKSKGCGGTCHAAQAVHLVRGSRNSMFHFIDFRLRWIYERRGAGENEFEQYGFQRARRKRHEPQLRQRRDWQQRYFRRDAHQCRKFQRVRFECQHFRRRILRERNFDWTDSHTGTNRQNERDIYSRNISGRKWKRHRGQQCRQLTRDGFSHGDRDSASSTFGDVQLDAQHVYRRWI
jgi:hypothetical protein